MAAEQPKGRALVVTEGAKGGGRSPVEAPNTIRAKMIMHVIWLLTEGPVRGLWDGGKSIFFGEPPVPLVAADGTANYLGVEWEFRDGSPGQEAIKGVPAIETAVSVAASVTVAGGPVVRAIDCSNADRLRIIIQIPALVSVDTVSGDQNPTSFSYTVDWRVSGTSDPWNLLYADTVNGKCVAPAPRATTTPVPARDVLEIRMTRTTPDSVSSSLQNSFLWFAYVAITDRLMEYPGSALIAASFDAEQWGSQPPQATFGMYLQLLWVPANYDPLTRVYATSGLGTSGGIWDGTMKQAWSDNPAWWFYTVASNPDWGAGQELAGYADKFALYAISQYSDELVPDGFGGQEPRYTCNCYINEREEAIRVLQAIAQVFRGMAYFGGGKVVPVADMPIEPKMLVTPANIIDGKFRYESTSTKARHNVVRVRWRDPAQNYRENVEVVQDGEDIAVTGVIRDIDYDAMGCTSRGMARRIARWVLYSEKYEGDMCSWRAFRDHLGAMPGDIVLTADPGEVGVSQEGRLVAQATTTAIVLDRRVGLLSGHVYTVRVQLPDGTLSAALPVTNTLPAEADELTLGGGGLDPAKLPQAGATWMLVVDGKPVHRRILDITEDKDESFTVTALRHHPGKFALIEDGIAFDDEPWTIYPSQSAPLDPPTNPDVQEYLSGVGTTSLVRVTFGWTRSADRRAIRYRTQALLDGVIIRDVVTEQNSAEFNDLTPGDYVFQVQAGGEFGLASAWAATDVIHVDGHPDAPGVPSDLAASGAIKQVIVTWANPVSRYLRGVEIWGGSTSTFGAATKLGEETGGRFLHAPLPVDTVRYYWVRSVDLFGNFSAFIGPVSATTSYVITADLADAILNTAKLAQALQPPKLVTALPSVGEFDGAIYYRTGDKTLWKWSSGAWVAADASELEGRLMATKALFGQVEAGIIGATEIAAEAIHANHLAVEELIADTIQVKDLIIGTRKLTNDAATQIAYQQLYTSVSHISAPSAAAVLQVLATVNVSIDANSDGRFIIHNRANNWSFDDGSGGADTGGSGPGGGE